MSARTLLRPRDDTRDADHPPRRPAKPAGGLGATWTSERVAQLKQCIDAGLSCSKIAAELGVSRNAVIGKMSRLRLSRPKPAPARAASPKRALFRTGALARILARQQVLEIAPPLQPGACPIAILDGRGCQLLDLTPSQCRWPINEPGTADFCFCGSTKLAGLPYCLGHARLAYKSTAGSA